jgi:hypothetical protein
MNRRDHIVVLSSLIALSIVVLSILLLRSGAGTGSGGSGVRQADGVAPLDHAPTPQLEGNPGEEPSTAIPPAQVPLEASPGQPSKVLIEGVVYSPEDTPVSEAMVWFVPAEERGLVDPGPSVQTDQDGHFVCSVQPDASGRVHVVARGFLPWAEHIALAGPREPIVHLQRGETISGHVRDALGRPIAGVLLACWTGSSQSVWPLGALLRSECAQEGGTSVSDADGAFTIGGLASGPEYCISTRKAGYFGNAVFPLAAGATGVEVTMAPLVRTRIHFRDAVSGQELHGVMTVTRFIPRGLAVVSGRDADFNWDLPSPAFPFLRDYDAARELSPDANLKIWAQLAGYDAQEAWVPIHEGRIDDYVVLMHPLPEGESRRVQFVAQPLDNATSFSGQLVLRTESGSRVLDFRDRRATDWVALRMGRNSVGISGARPEGWWCRDAGPRATFEVTDGSAAPQVVNLALDVGFVILRVVDAAGREVPEYDLDVRVNDQGTGWYPRWNRECQAEINKRIAAGWASQLPATTPYLMLEPGTYTILARAAESGQGRAEVHLQSGEGLVTCTIRLSEE